MAPDSRLHLEFERLCECGTLTGSFIMPIISTTFRGRTSRRTSFGVCSNSLVVRGVLMSSRVVEASFQRICLSPRSYSALSRAKASISGPN